MNSLFKSFGVLSFLGGYTTIFKNPWSFKKRMALTRYFFVFCLGFLSCLFLGYIFFYSGVEMPFGTGFVIGDVGAPSTWVADEEIILFDNEVLLRIENVSMSRYASTGSMLPTLGRNSRGLVVVPRDVGQVGVGDIVSFRDFGRLIVHRVVEKGTDEEGVYFITKGDNSDFLDGKIRFEDIEHVLIGILY
jgi:hypothetical protein